MKTKQTSVDWLEDKIATYDFSQGMAQMRKYILQAKQMEKEQLEKFYLLGDKDGFESCYYHNSNCLDFEQYYNETYGKI